MANPVFTQVRDRLQRLIKNVDPSKVKTSIQAYRAWGTALLRGSIPGNAVMTGQPERLANRLGQRHIGRMVMFFYDPKWKEELPYYDRFPLIMPLTMYKDGFLGMNLHYIPPLQRAKVLDLILNIYDDKHINERKKLQMSYSILQRVVKSRVFMPCIKRYLSNHVKSRFFIVDPADWQIVILLPLERFEKKSRTGVWSHSMLEVNLAKNRAANAKRRAKRATNGV